jgi:hypothetical protein
MKFTPEIIAEKKTRPYMIVELFDKVDDCIKTHHLFEIGDTEEDVSEFTIPSLLGFGMTDILTRGYICRNFRDRLSCKEDVKKITVMINDKKLAHYDYTVPSIFDLMDACMKEPTTQTPKPKRKYTKKSK